MLAQQIADLNKKVDNKQNDLLASIVTLINSFHQSTASHSHLLAKLKALPTAIANVVKDAVREAGQVKKAGQPKKKFQSKAQAAISSTPIKKIKSSKAKVKEKPKPLKRRMKSNNKVKYKIKL